MTKLWPIKTLGEVCDVIGGGTPSKSIASFYQGEIPWATVRDMKSDIISRTEYCISKEALNKSSTNLIPKYSVVIASRVGLGKVCIVQQDTAINQDLRGIIPKDKKQINERYLFWYLKLSAPKIIEAGTGATVQGVKLPFIKSLEFPIPPVEQQEIIVRNIEKAFSGIEGAIENTKKNLSNTRRLFEAYVLALFDAKNKDWKDYKLSDVCIVERGSSPRPIKKYFTEKSDGVNWIKIGDTEEGGKYVYSTAQKITPEGARQSRFVKEGDFILTNSMSFGRPYIMKTKGYIHDGWFVLRLNDSIDVDYFYYLLSSKFVQDQFTRLASGAVVKNISGDLVKKAILPIPSILEQKAIAKKLDELSQYTKSLEGIYQKKIDYLLSLKQSILQDAFSGKLSQNTDNVVSIKSASKQADTKSPEFSAKVIGYSFYWHEAQRKQRTFGHVKTQKLLQLTESIAGIDLGRNPMKDAAGPNDFPHMLKAKNWAEANKFFKFVERNGGYTFTKLENYDDLVASAIESIKPYKDKLDKILALLLPMDTKKAEVFATIHAAWNNLVLDRVKITDEAIIKAARDDWHSDKMNIPVNLFYEAIRQIKSEGLVPNGKAKRVMGQEKLI